MMGIGYGLFDNFFLLVLPIQLVIVIVLLYQLVYGKQEKKQNLGLWYTRLMTVVLVVLLFVFVAKIGDDMIDNHYSTERDALNQSSNYYLDIYACQQKNGIFDTS